MSTTVYHNATIITPQGATEAFAVTEGSFSALGTRKSVRDTVDADATEVDLAGATVIPGIVDSHIHLRDFGESLTSLDLTFCDTLDQIQELVREACAAEPARVEGKGWGFTAIPQGSPTKEMLDEVSGDIPVYLIAFDFHSVWVNSAGLRELGVDRDTPDPPGGSFERDAAGELTGMLWESAFLEICHGRLEKLKPQTEHRANISAALDAYAAVGVTTVMDMLQNEVDVSALRSLLNQNEGRLPARVRGYWSVPFTQDHEAHLTQVRRAASLAAELNTAETKNYYQLIGIKLIVDGVIDGCTAAMKQPFANGKHPGTLWPAEYLRPVVAEAHQLGLSIALHAIGDEASEISLDALAAAIDEHGPVQPGQRHRLEHLETITPENISRLAALGVVACMQPVHSDPAIQENWRAMLGDDRVIRGFPQAEVEQAGAVLALSTDAPTALYRPFKNFYTAVTRKSPSQPDLPANHPEMAISAELALTGMTTAGAYVAGAERVFGSIEPGLFADFAVLDRNPLTISPEHLPTIRVLQTVVGGTVINSD